MRTLGSHIDGMVPAGWSWCIYGPSAMYAARAVLVSPDHRIHIGREAQTIDDAIRAASRAARSGEKS